MFGLTESEMDLYRKLAQDFAVAELTPRIAKDAGFITPLIDYGDDHLLPDESHVNLLVNDLETVITITVTHMAYDYAYLQSVKEEDEIIKHLNDKYESFVIDQFIKYGITFTYDAVKEIVGESILEMPFIYAGAIQEELFDEDEFLEDRLQHYNDYLNENFSETEEEEEW